MRQQKSQLVIAKQFIGTLLYQIRRNKPLETRKRGVASCPDKKPSFRVFQPDINWNFLPCLLHIRWASSACAAHAAAERGRGVCVHAGHVLKRPHVVALRVPRDLRPQLLWPRVRGAVQASRRPVRTLHLQPAGRRRVSARLAGRVLHASRVPPGLPQRRLQEAQRVPVSTIF